MNFRSALTSSIRFSQGRLYQTLAFTFCFAFGIALIANINTAADGTWISYAVIYNHGTRLYSQLHFVQQPLFVLETAWFMDLTGRGWVVSKIPAVLHLAAFLLGILWIIRQVSMSDRQKAILCGAAFSLTINSVAYRFDDYHVLADIFALFSVVLLLKLRRISGRQSLVLIMLLGVLSASSFETRSNDGAALFLAVGISIFCLARNRKMVLLASFTATAALTALILVRLTGDSFRDYWVTSISKAAGSKGGVGSVLDAPLRMPLNALLFFRGHHRSVVFAVLFITVCIVWTYLIRPAILTRTKKAIVTAAIAVILVLVPISYMYSYGLLDRIFFLSIWAMVVLPIYAFGIVAIVRLVVSIFVPSRFGECNRLDCLFLIPSGLMASGAMSSGGRLDESYFPFAIFLLLLPIASPIDLRPQGKSFLLAAATILFGFGCVHRVMQPFRWLNAANLPMFVNREWFRHPVYGPMVIQRDMLTFIQPVCRFVGSDGPDTDLLSLPYSFANYFCVVPPWHDHVQTWYDTSSKFTIDSLLGDLQHSPPKWIFYQRQPETLKIHQDIFNGGKPLPYGKLDQFIEQKLGDGTWKIVYKSSYESTRDWNDAWLSQEWFLIQTRP